MKSLSLARFFFIWNAIVLVTTRSADVNSEPFCITMPRGDILGRFDILKSWSQTNQGDFFKADNLRVTS